MKSSSVYTVYCSEKDTGVSFIFIRGSFHK